MEVTFPYKTHQTALPIQLISKLSRPGTIQPVFGKAPERRVFFNITTSASNTIVDLIIALKMGDNYLNPYMTTIPAVATPGDLYYLGMDGLSSATSLFSVLSLPTL
jgi:hypothetical protein